MTNIGTIILILISVGIGYVLEPVFFSGSNRGKEKKAKDTTEAGNAAVEEPKEAPPSKPEIKVDLSQIIAADFPEKVTLKVPHTITDAASGISMSLKKGMKVKPLRLEGDKLAIQSVDFPIKGMIHVDQTDFKKLAVPLMLKRLQNPVVQKDPEPTPAPAPAPTPEPAPAVAKKLDEPAIIALMKTSVSEGKVTEFKAAQVTTWKAGGEMEFDGETYQTGRVTFKAETILGVQEHDAIALIEDGKISKWMWAKTKLEMR